MSLSLVEGAKLSNDVLLQGVIETIIKDSPVLQQMPFIQIVGNGLTYNQEATLPGAAFYDVGGTWAESTPTFTQKTAILRILGGDADVDNYLRATRSNVQDIETAVIELKAKAVRHAFEQAFIYGIESSTPAQFDGLVELIDTDATSAQVIAAGATGATLTLTMVDTLIDAVKGGKPDLLLMSRRSRRKLNNLARVAGNNLEVGQGALGEFVQYYNGIPVGVSDWVLDTHVLTASLETAYTGGLCSTIYAVQFGEGGLCGLTSPEGLQVERIGSLESKDATRNRIKWYVSLALFSKVKAAALIGVKD